jgi:hypothetical protein
MNKKVIIVTADYNDGDYDTRETSATPELIEIAKHVCSVIKKDPAWGKNDMKDGYNDPQRWVKSGDLTDIEVETFDDMCPSGDQAMGVHTIESVKIVEVLDELI